MARPPASASLPLKQRKQTAMLIDEVKKAVEVMRAGGVILYPTDTVWGIGCDATNPEAVKKVYEIKRRDDSKALISLVDSDLRLQRYVRNVADVTWNMIELSEKPLTVIFDNVSGLAPNLIAADGSAGIRITREEFSKELCFRFQKPVVSTSANISGEPTPQTFDEISDEIKEAVDYVVKYNRQCREKHKPSSIIKMDANGQFTIIRE